MTATPPPRGLLHSCCPRPLWIVGAQEPNQSPIYFDYHTRLGVSIDALPVVVKPKSLVLSHCAQFFLLLFRGGWHCLSPGESYCVWFGALQSLKAPKA